MGKMIQISEVSKQYKNERVVSGATMTVTRGEIYGFLGPNGAGKTTIMKMLLNLVKPTSGEIRINNHQILGQSSTYLKKIGSLIETPVFYTKLTARENLFLHGEYMGGASSERVDEVLEIVHLAEVADKLVTEYSLGMKQRLGIARAILMKPEILILDEPINGLDPIGIKEVRELLLMLKNKYGMTVLISSHIVSEIEWIADTIGVINQGKVLQEVKLSEIREVNNAYLAVEVSDVNKALVVLEQDQTIEKIQIDTNQLIYLHGNELDQSDITKQLILADVAVHRIEKQQKTLEEYFLSIISGGK
ncbi:bacitracin ABC transporter ATP-binding protein [Enterococcus sp. JM4C]|nr:bacitracin ABC transporter ATP-binding protein [Enterococcus sp. JM4C]